MVTAAGETIKTAAARRRRRQSVLRQLQAAATNNAEDALSVGVHVTSGNSAPSHLGDLTWNKEFELMCPNNRIGAVDLLLGLHHGQAISNSEVLVHATHPRVAIMNNGTRKGGEPETMRVVHSSPGLEDLWQMHFSQLSGQEYTVPGMFIANMLDDPLAAMPMAPITAPPPVRRAAAAGPQRPGLLDQGRRANRRHLHRHQYPQRLQQDLRGAAARHELRRGQQLGSRQRGPPERHGQPASLVALA